MTLNSFADFKFTLNLGSYQSLSRSPNACSKLLVFRQFVYSMQHVAMVIPRTALGPKKAVSIVVSSQNIVHETKKDNEWTRCLSANLFGTNSWTEHNSSIFHYIDF